MCQIYVSVSVDSFYIVRDLTFPISLMKDLKDRSLLKLLFPVTIFNFDKSVIIHTFLTWKLNLAKNHTMLMSK